MDDLERRINAAAEETRRSSQVGAPPPLSTSARFRPRGWLVFAAAFVAVLLIGVLPLIFGGDAVEPAGTTLPAAVATTRVTTSVTTPACSSAGVDRPAEVDKLPDQVQDIRLAVIGAAIACDFEALVTYAALGGERFTTNFGGGGAEMFQEWEDTGEGKLGLLLKVLATDYAVQTFEGDAAAALGSDTLYVWPAAFARDSWDEITEEEMADLLTIYTQEELDEISAFGSYAGWRTGITAEGDWVFFVAGD